MPGQAEKSSFPGGTATSRALHNTRFHYSLKIVLLTTVPTVSQIGYWLTARRTFVQCRIHGASRGILNQHKECRLCPSRVNSMRFNCFRAWPTSQVPSSARWGRAKCSTAGSGSSAICRLPQQQPTAMFITHGRSRTSSPPRNRGRSAREARTRASRRLLCYANCPTCHPSLGESWLTTARHSA